MCADNSGLPNGCPTGQQLNINKSSINGKYVTIRWTDCCQFWHMNVASRAKTQPEWNHWHKLLKHASHSTSLKIFLQFRFFLNDELCRDVDTLWPHLCSLVKPNPPENVTVLVESDEIPNLHISWEPPDNTDVRSGWITLKYSLRVRQENNSKWKVSFQWFECEWNRLSVNIWYVFYCRNTCQANKPTSASTASLQGWCTQSRSAAD